MEIWKTIPNNTEYEASNLGNIRSKSNTYTSTYKGTPVTRKKKTKLIGNKLSPKGYKRIKLDKVYFVHRLIAETFISNPNSLSQVNHINGIKTDNRVENLEWVSNQQNRDHAVKHNLVANRSNGYCKLTISQIIEIQKLYNINKFKQKEIANMYNVCQQTISKVLQLKV